MSTLERDGRKDGTMLLDTNAAPALLDPADTRLVTFAAALKGHEAGKLLELVDLTRRQPLVLAGTKLGALDRPARLRRLAEVLKAPATVPAEPGNERPWALPGARVIGRPQPVIATLLRRLHAP